MFSKNKTSGLSALLLVIAIMMACNEYKPSRERGFDIVGAWELVCIEHPDGRVETMNMGKYTRCKIYDADSTYFSVEFLTDGAQVIVIPHEMARYTLDDSLYIENGRPTPFRIINDTTMTTFWDGYTEVMIKATSMTESRKKEIRDIVRTYFNSDIGKDRLSSFIMSTSERELQSDNQRLVYVIIILLFASVALGVYFVQTLRRKRQLERQLREVQVIRDLRPQPVRNAMKDTEASFFKSEYYIGLRRKIEAGSNFSPEEWKQLEMELKTIYPDFSSALYQMYNLSQMEYRVCLLTKIRTTPTEIAAVLKREPSSISSMRGRLYHKIFKGKGGAKEWDEFIMSL